MEQIAWPGPGFEKLVARAADLIERPGRAILGIAGAPACGKSTLADDLAKALTDDYPGVVAQVGMDAFHLGQRVLDRQGLAGIKGAPQTFDVHGYRHLLQRMHQESGQSIYAPAFHREIEDSIAHEVEIAGRTRLVITEGNYLLLPDPPWDQVRGQLDEAWFVHLIDPVRRERLRTRHRHYGADQAEAERKTMGSDEANARLVNSVRGVPDVWIEVSPDAPVDL